MFLEYGIENNYLDITDQTLNKPNPIVISSDDEERNLLFGDPVPHQYKHIKMTHNMQNVYYGIGEPVILYVFNDLNHDISFGTDYQRYPIRDIVYSYCYQNELLVIPANNHERNYLFGDPMMGIDKDIMIDQIKYEPGVRIAIYIPKFVLFRALMTKKIPATILRLAEVTNLLHKRHTMLSFQGGNGKMFYELQLLVALFIQPHNIVLQLEAGIGQVSLTIAHFTNKLLALTSKEKTMPFLILNRDLNHHTFPIQNTTLGYDLLVRKGDDLIPYKTGAISRWSYLIKTITYESLVEQYQMKFDTLVAGNLWHLRDHLDIILNTMTTLILSNGYYELQEKQIIDSILQRLGFERVHVIKGGWGPCVDCFYEVWLR